MRKTTTAAVFFLLLGVLAGVPAYATDCSAGGMYSAGGYYWVDYSAENLTEQKSTWDCWSLSGLSATTMTAFSSTPGFEIRALSGNATRSFTVPTGAGGHYEIQMFTELFAPSPNWYDQLRADVAVYHPATNTNTTYSLYYHNSASDGDDQGSVPYVDIYNVAAGDTITIYIQGAWSFDSSSHSRFSNVHIFHLLNF